ncbi:MAG: alpha/beta hydrolase [Alphaproteobacteria bacterium]|nr:alpha/beta hydrolase [Alphaproteobacteria bacterium]
MPHIKTSDGVQLYYEETGEGAPLLFMHEFGGHYLSWEPQVRHFSRLYRCIAYAARGWPPSDVPEDVASYSQARAADDAADVMKALGIDKAHLCGLSMGATAALEFAIRHPGKALSLTIAAGGGGGSTEAAAKVKFKQECESFAQRIEREGMPAMAELYCTSSARVTYKYKDPRGWAEFKQQFADGSAKGHAMTMRGVQGGRQPFFERTAELQKISEPMLVIIGDEDESTHGLAVHLKENVLRCGVLEMPRTGHTMNLEEPAAFNAAVESFLHAVERDRWPARAGKTYTLIPPSR